MFKLKRPCKTCPFKKGQGERFQLGVERLREIVRSPSFQCHNTIDYDCDQDDKIARQGKNPQQCAGLISVMHKSGQMNQITQVATRIAGYDPALLEHSNTYDSIEDAIEAHNG